MGGTGALMFCGQRKLQLLITRRDPDIRDGDDPTGDRWAVTLVRRESPPEGPGQVRNPYFKFLAPVGAAAHPGAGEVLSFPSETLPLMPSRNQPYARDLAFGSCLKLYEYDMQGFKGHVLRTAGLLSRLEILLPELALPMRLHECREGYRGGTASYDTTLMGFRERVEDSRSENLEDGYPASLPLNVLGERMAARIYAFKRDPDDRKERGDRYRSDQGVVFTING